jgi:3'-phosphoadenosine 5'-phosphosulfate sulfotransferase (PAPS reductase)/FAD synthetase
MNPYKIDGPAVVSFSGGRTSGFMLAKIVEAHGGKLPSDILPLFCNTGLEHPKTYEFVEKVSKHIAPVTWLEYRRKEDGPDVAVVDENTYSKNGEPFEALIRACNYVPNPVTRKCTVELKIRTNIRYCRSLGWDEWTNCVGLRADEPRRVAKMKGDAKSEQVCMPIAEAGHTVKDVLEFWKSMPFDLELPNNDNAFGNCTLCFLKSKARLQKVLRKEPEHAEWWIRMESLGLSSKPSGARFRNDRPSYAAMLEIAKTQSVMFDDTEEDTISCACTE